jgi:ribosome maturation factor RimP
MADRKQLIRLLEPEVRAMGYELVDLLYREGNKHALLRLYIDLQDSDTEQEVAEGELPRAVGLDDCQKVSHQVSGLLDVEDPIPWAFELEVSSPGANRPLRTEAHFQRFIGERVKVELVDQGEERRRYTGEVESVGSGSVVLNVDDERFELELDSIDRARLVPAR